MKIILSLILIHALQTVHAQENEYDYEISASKWRCIAAGIDSNNNYRSVPGDSANTRKQARQSAIMQCQSMGLSFCQIKNCYN